MATWDPILIVDDDEDHRWLMCVLLREAGFTAVPLDGGAALLRYLDEGGRAGLIVLDLNMPGMAGEEVHGRLQADPVRAAIPIVVLSGVANFRGLPGVAAQIAKGGEPEVLLQLIASIYRGAR